MAPVLVLFVVFTLITLNAGEKFMGTNGRRVRGKNVPHGTKTLSDELHMAVAEALGDGHGISQSDLLVIHQVMDPMWASLPKNANGRVDRRLLRYLVHRYFMSRYMLSIVGLEPAHVNSSHSEAALLLMHAPGYVKETLEGKSALDGFSLEDAVGLAAVLERLVADAGRDLLDRAYGTQGRDIDDDLSGEQLHEVLVDYMVHWMLGDDQESITELVANRTLLTESFADWPSIAGFAAGQISRLQHRSVYNTQPDIHSSYNPFNQKFSFADAQHMISDVTTEFGKFWETECQSIKTLLVDMDKDNTGRVKLKDFYGTAMGGEWRFSESKEYLRQLGSLDESSKWHGPRVIITNYLQGSNNCIVSAPHYRVCCANECESIMEDLERIINKPTASPEDILPLVGNMSATLDDDRPKLDSTLVNQLYRIAEISGNNQIPLHGRLFAQWLHYVFPRHCPFPAKSGTTVALSPLEFGDNFIATDSEMEDHVKAGEQPLDAEVEEEDWMSQWSHDEELLTDYAHLEAPWEKRRAPAVLFILMVGGAVLAFFFKVRKGDASGGSSLPSYAVSSGSQFGMSTKSHLV